MTQANKRKKLVLIDGHAIIHRAFHAVPEDLSTSSGEPVNATFGFTSMLMKALLEERPDYIAVTFDRPTPTFRHEQYAPYKAHRPTLPDNMRPQFSRIREVVQAFGIEIYEKDGYEADDVLGTLSVQAKAQGVDTIIYTGDMDTLQLVNEQVLVKVAKRGISEVVEYDEKEVQARYGFAPHQLIDYKGLVGDKSDNIPGVAGIGAKTATRLIVEYGNLENILAHASELKPKEQKLLQEGEEQGRQSKFLATIVLDAPVSLDLEACRMTHVDSERILTLFRQLEFRNQVERVFALFRQLGVSVTSEGDSRLQPLEELDARSASESTAGDERERLLLAPPLGIVPILPLPQPPGREEVAPEYVATAPASTGEARVATEPRALPETQEEQQDGPMQLSLFDTPEPRAEVARKLRLPGPALVETSLFFEESNVQSPTSTMIINSEEGLDVLVKSLRDAGHFAFDTETTSEDQRKADLVGLSFAMAPGEAYYIPVGHTTTVDGQEPGTQLPLSHVLVQLKPIFEDASIGKYMHNAKYDIAVMLRYGIQVEGLSFDSMLAAYLIEPGRRGLGLKEQAFQRLSILMTPITELIGSGSKIISMAQVPIRRAADYAGSDADMTLRLVVPLHKDLQKHNLLDLFYRLEMPLIKVLMQMELYGVALDAEFLHEFGEQLNEQLRKAEQTIYDAVGHHFNVNSPKQLGEVLFVELKLPAGKKTKTGYSVSADVIENLRGMHPAIDSLLEYRQLSKLKSTYIDGLQTLMDRQTGRVYTSFNQTIASSGRLSSSNPNLQNIPVRTELGRQIRRAFIADPSYVLLTADYSQIELRILANITNEPRLVEAFNQGEDIHTITAASLFSVPVEEVTRDQRRLAKTVVYAVLYGQSAYGLSQVTGMRPGDAADFIKRYHETFPNIKVYVESTLEQARRQGYVNTCFGRKRFIPDMRVLSHVERQALEREAVNMPIQGSNADLIKVAMLRLQHAFLQNGMKTRMILQVHDELVFEVPVEELERAKRIVKAVMEGIGALLVPQKVPIKVDMKSGKNWFAAEPVV
ncbi:DNA polymerase I [Ktedonobacter racemifer]|uniref:DNA polymerase I n=1 Tax=Ktedonobacter racemifer DSM 44963 TaxID=485913 RepID=D6TJA2_KTERA|nr:DNA polymerase I [Ktedonobacter racemifer]EFH89509.1 DNA polymerase I [Ktedonobacter racemifer DSM 44963]